MGTINRKVNMKDSDESSMSSFSHQDEEEHDGNGAFRKRKKSKVVSASDGSKETGNAQKKKKFKTFHLKENSVAASKQDAQSHMVEPDLSTTEGQLMANPGMTLHEAKGAAKREYNRLNAARARQRNKMTVEQLQRKIVELQGTVEQLQRSNQGLTVQMNVLSQQNRCLIRQQAHLPSAPVAVQKPAQQVPLSPTRHSEISNVFNNWNTLQRSQSSQPMAAVIQPTQAAEAPVPDVLAQLQQLLGQQQQTNALHHLLQQQQPQQDLASQLLQGLPSHALLSMLQQQSHLNNSG